MSLYLLFPVTIVGLFAQNTIPGDFLYPLKLNMENAGAVIFSLTPESKASYDSSITERRFDEAQKLITYNSNTAGLPTLVQQTTKTQESVAEIKNPEQKKVLQEILVNEINTYQEKLTQTQQRVDPDFVAPTPTPTIFLRPTRTQLPPKLPIQNYPSPTAKIFFPTPTLQNTGSPIQQPPLQIINDIETTKQQLEEIKNQIQQSQLEEQQQQPTTPTLSPTPTFMIPTPTKPIYISPTYPINQTYPHPSPTLTTNESDGMQKIDNQYPHRIESR